MMSIYEDRFDDVTILILGNALLDPVEECLVACFHGDSVDDSVGDNVIYFDECLVKFIYGGMLLSRDFMVGSYACNRDFGIDDICFVCHLCCQDICV